MFSCTSDVQLFTWRVGGWQQPVPVVTVYRNLVLYMYLVEYVYLVLYMYLVEYVHLVLYMHILPYMNLVMYLYM